jgi:P-type Ca2+ transporter type 2C
LMERKPRPLSQPVLSTSQWLRIVFLGILMAIGTLILEGPYGASDAAVAATMGFAVFCLFSVVVGLSARSETRSAFNREVFHDRHQLMLYGLALLLTLLPPGLGMFGLTSLNVNQWLICISFAFALLLVDEVIKVFMRARRKASQPAPALAASTAA